MNQNKSPFHLDAGESAYFDKELTYVKSQTYDVIRKDLKAIGLIPVESDAPSGAEFIEYRSFDAVGVAKIVSDYSTDFPKVDVYAEAKQVKVKSLGDSYGYSIQEIRRAAMVPGTKLDVRRAQAARRAIDELQDKIAWFGDTASGLQGFINHPNMSEYVAAAGASGFKDWARKTTDEIMKDVTGILTSASVATNGKEVVDTLILPLELYNILAFTPYGEDKDKTLLTFMRQNFPQLTKVDWVQELVGAGAGGVDRVIAYTRRADKVALQIPQAFEQMPYQLVNMEYKINCHQRTAGVILYYPASAVFVDGLGV